MEVLKLGVVQGVQACNLGVTILAEELERDAAGKQAALGKLVKKGEPHAGFR